MKRDNNSLIWIVVAIVALLLISSLGFSGFGYGMMGMMYGNYGYSMMPLGWIYGILILVALSLFIVWLIKQIQKK